MYFGTANSFGALDLLKVGKRSYHFFNLKIVCEKLGINLAQLPNPIKILLENLVRFEDGKIVTKGDIEAIKHWLAERKSSHEIAYHPSRVLMQDFTGVPAVVDLAAMRDATKLLGGDPKKINPLIPVDLVIDHSVQVDKYASANAFDENVKLEMMRNKERYEFLKWGQSAFDNFQVVPPGTGICHQVNLEYLAKVVWSKEQDGKHFAYPDTLVGTDSHTTMINGLSVLGWGVGGIEAEAAMLGQAISMLLPEVIGFNITGKLNEGTTATDLVLTVTQMLRNKGVVNKFVEFYGPGVKELNLANRATIANMAPEYGATCGFFPVDDETINYLKLSSRPQELIELVEAYSKAQGLWRNDLDEMLFSDTISLDLATVEPSLAGPKRPQDKIVLPLVKENFAGELPSINKNPDNIGHEYAVSGRDYKLKNGDVVIAAITSCTNTSNPYVMLGSALLARNALNKGLKVKPWVKTSLAPGSKVVSEYLEKAGLQEDLNELGFNLVGYGCTTCIGNSGPINEEIEKTISEHNLVVASVLSGNRNFEGRVHPNVRANYLASPMLVIAYAIAGTVNTNLAIDPLGFDQDGNEVFLRDIWPSNNEINKVVNDNVDSQMFAAKYATVFDGDAQWQELVSPKGMNYSWDSSSTYIKRPPYFDNMAFQPEGFKPIKGAKLLAVFGDSITTDHISPAGSIAKAGPAAIYLNKCGIENKDFNSYGARRGNHEVMMRGTFANVRIKNELVLGVEGGVTKINGVGEVVSIYDAAMHYIKDNSCTVIIAGKEYGTGSSRDWAAKGPNLLGVRMVISESFERIHRSNLVGMGIIPLQFIDGVTRGELELNGGESFDLELAGVITPKMLTKCRIYRDGTPYKEIDLVVRVDTEVEVEYIYNGGILNYVLRKLI